MLDLFLPPLDQITTDDERFMREALKEAMKAYKAKEVPVGCVIVKDGQIIARGHNQVELLQDATAHAEILAITSAENVVSNWRLKGCTMYCTLEPCVMCAGAMMLSRLDAIVWGAPDIRLGANGSWVDLFSVKHPLHTLQIRSGVLREWCQAPLKQFFQVRRKENDLKNKPNSVGIGEDGGF
ncbi:MAG: tRNA adenosine(34) deaminase TadA [Chlamydiales bacterium]|nr:tRNA adenosine(34) deaminase TadA [Chlamydiales bacterium]